MSHLYIAFGTTDGHTATVADAVRRALESAGHRVTVSNVMTETGVIPADATGVIVAGSLHVGQLQDRVKQFIAANRQRLAELPSAMVTVCLCVLKGESGRQEGLAVVKEQLQELGWRPDAIELVAGARDYAHYGFFKRLLMRWIARYSGSADTDMSKSYVYTDFEALRRFGLAFAERAGAMGPQARTAASAS